MARSAKARLVGVAFGVLALAANACTAPVSGDAKASLNNYRVSLMALG